MTFTKQGVRYDDSGYWLLARSADFAVACAGRPELLPVRRTISKSTLRFEPNGADVSDRRSHHLTNDGHQRSTLTCLTLYPDPIFVLTYVRKARNRHSFLCRDQWFTAIGGSSPSHEPANLLMEQIDRVT